MTLSIGHSIHTLKSPLPHRGPSCGTPRPNSLLSHKRPQVKGSVLASTGLHQWIEDGRFLVSSSIVIAGRGGRKLALGKYKFELLMYNKHYAFPRKVYFTLTHPK